MRKLGEQWVEEVNGEEHMVKASLPSLCAYCVDNLERDIGGKKCRHESCVVNQGHVKDLGILRDGFLPCWWDSKIYPTIDTPNDFVYRATATDNHPRACHMMQQATGHTLDELRERWNRRA